jgi:hypothetical protein
MVGYNLRFHPGLRRLKELVSQGAIGQVVSARATVGEYLPDWHPWEDYRRSYSGRRDLGGGAVLTFSHELDALCWLLGPPRRVSAMTAHASTLEINTEDVAEILLEFERGALGSVHVDYVRRSPQRTLELIGEQGVLQLDVTRNRLEHHAAATGQWRVEEGSPTFQRNDMYLDELRHFVACVRGEVDRPLIDGEQGAAILAIALAALNSAARGRTVELIEQGAIGEQNGIREQYGVGQRGAVYEESGASERVASGDQRGMGEQGGASERGGRGERGGVSGQSAISEERGSGEEAAGGEEGGVIDEGDIEVKGDVKEKGEIKEKARKLEEIEEIEKEEREISIEEGEIRRAWLDSLKLRR